MRSNQTKIKLSRWFYVIGFIVIISGSIISTISIFSNVFSNMNDLTQIPLLQIHSSI